ncbi:MAG: hypothetical protein ACK51L_00830 [bacterium]
MVNNLQRHVTVGDFVKFFDSHCHSTMGLGEIVNDGTDRVRIKLFHFMSSEVMQSNFVPPINPRDYPLASQDEIQEVYQSSEEQWIARHMIVDVAFIVPIEEVESGRFFLSCAENTFVIRYCLISSSMLPWTTNYYFSRFQVEPFSVRLFHSLNTLSDHVRRSMFHRPEAQTTVQSFTIPMFPPESFYYLAVKLADNTIQLTVNRKQRSIKYYNSLKMESVVKNSTFTYIRILSKAGLSCLRTILGQGIGLGLAIARPTKQRPVSCCYINNNVTSIECDDITQNEMVALQPQTRCTSNGIDINYSEQNRILSCRIRFMKFVVKCPEDVTSRLPSAEVVQVSSGVYPEALFHYNSILYEVIEINIETLLVKCAPVQDFDAAEIMLPVDLIENLIAQFGT